MTTHCDDLAFVMEGVGEDVMEDECRSADSRVTVGEVKFGVRVQLLVGESGQVLVCAPNDCLLERNSIRNPREVGGDAIDVTEPLQCMDPETFAIEDVDHLPVERAEAEAGQFRFIRIGRNCGEVIENDSDSSVRPIVKFANAIDCEHGSLPILI